MQAAKYDWALTTIHGLNTAQTEQHLLRRIVVDVDQHWLMVAAKASGVWDFFVGLYRMPITLMRNRLALHEMTGLTGENRTLEQWKEHYEIEKELATRLPTKFPTGNRPSILQVSSNGSVISA